MASLSYELRRQASVNVGVQKLCLRYWNRAWMGGAGLRPGYSKLGSGSGLNVGFSRLEVSAI